MGLLVHGALENLEPLSRGDPTEVGGYRLRARLGSGGMGQVYLSFTPGGRPVAVKVIRPEIADDPEFRGRFAHEVQSAQRVNGVYIAQLLDAGPDAATPWLATAYVAGPTLLEAVRVGGPFSTTSVKTLMAGIAESLQAIHAAGIVHRDLKPANVVLGADGLRVIDFGIAHVVDSTSLTPSGRLIGSPHYTAPEQILGRSASPATDVFALGALACYAATGRSAFGDGPGIAIVFRIVNSDPDLEGCPDELRTLLMACLAKAAADRPTTAELLEICRPDRAPSTPAEWLSPTVVQLIESRVAALEDLASQPTPSSATEIGASRPGRPRGSARHAAEPVVPRRLRGRAAISVTAGLLLVAAVAGVALGIVATGGGGSHQTDLSAADTTRQSQPPPGDGDHLPPPLPIQWYGSVSFTNTGIDLDEIPPANMTAAGNDHSDVLLSQAGPAATISTGDSTQKTLTLWTGSSEPNPRQCMAQIDTQGTSQLRVAVGDVVCMQTGRGRVALLMIKSIGQNLWVGLAANAIVWTLPTPPPLQPSESGPPQGAPQGPPQGASQGPPQGSPSTS